MWLHQVIATHHQSNRPLLMSLQTNRYGLGTPLPYDHLSLTKGPIHILEKRGKHKLLSDGDHHK